MIRDVMVFTPVYRLEAETVQAIFALEWEGALTIVLQRDNPTRLPVGMKPAGDWDDPTELETGVINHIHQYQRGRETFLASACEALLVIESDVIPPTDTLKRLAALECDVAYGCYMLRSCRPVINIFERYKPWPERTRNIGESLSVRGLWAAALARGIIECSGAGLGCVLIRREVLERVPFERVSSPRFFDLEWTQAVYEQNYRMMADTRVLCGHKRPDGEVIWPF